MNFTQAVTSGFTRYVDFRGRSSRSEYWYWVLFSAILGFVLGFCKGLFIGLEHGPNPVSTVFGVLQGLTNLALLLPSIAIIVRRLHDTNRSGWWYFIVFTIIGIIPILIWLCTRGTIGENRFGPDPLAAAEPAAKPEETWAT